jgi:hypothetical protein
MIEKSIPNPTISIMGPTPLRTPNPGTPKSLSGISTPAFFISPPTPPRGTELSRPLDNGKGPEQDSFSIKLKRKLQEIAPTEISPAPAQVSQDLKDAKTLFAHNREHKEIPSTPRLAPFMEPMIESYNARKPGMNVRYAENPEHMFKMLEESKGQLQRGPMHFVLTTGIHQSAWRFHNHQGHITAIGMDTVEVRFGTSGGSTKFQFLKELQKHPGLVKSSALVETCVQKDKISCAAYAMGFLNTFEKYPDDFGKLSRDLLRRENGESVPHLPKKEEAEGSGFRVIHLKQAFKVLPAHAFKNAQNPATLEKFKESEPEKFNGPVNKHGETIESRLQGRTKMDGILQSEIREKMDPDVVKELMGRGISDKRIRELNYAIEHRQDKPGLPDPEMDDEIGLRKRPKKSIPEEI